MNLHLVYLLVPERQKSSHFFSTLLFLLVYGWISWFLLRFVTIQALVDLSLFRNVHWYLLHIEKLPGLRYLQLIFLRLVRQLNILWNTCVISWRLTYNVLPHSTLGKFRYDIKQNELLNWMNCLICYLIDKHILLSFDCSLGVYKSSILLFHFNWLWNFRLIFYAVAKWFFFRTNLPNLVGKILCLFRFVFSLIFWLILYAILEFRWWRYWVWMVSFVISWNHACIVFWRQKCGCHIFMAFLSRFASIFLEI